MFSSPDQLRILLCCLRFAVYLDSYYSVMSVKLPRAEKVSGAISPNFTVFYRSAAVAVAITLSHEQVLPDQYKLNQNALQTSH
jgi:hypothetical protein